MSIEPTSLAPHVAPGWVDDLVLELRLRDVPGDVIGDTLAEVDAHVVDSGTPAHEAFGDPVTYATRVAEHAAKVPPDGPRADVLPAVGGVALVAVIEGVVGWPDDATATIHVGTLLLAALLAVLPFAVHRWGTPLLRVVVQRPWWQTWALLMVVTAPFVGVGLLGRSWEITTVPALPLGVAGIVTLVVTGVLGTRGRDVDPVVGPADDVTAAEAAVRRETRRLSVLTTTTQLGALAVVLTVLVLVLRV